MAEKDCDAVCMHCLIQTIWRDEVEDLPEGDSEAITHALTQFWGQTLNGLACTLANATPEVRQSFLEEGKRALDHFVAEAGEIASTERKPSKTVH